MHSDFRAALIVTELLFSWYLGWDPRENPEAHEKVAHSCGKEAYKSGKKIHTSGKEVVGRGDMPSSNPTQPDKNLSIF